MNFVAKIYSTSGKILYKMLLPVLRLYLRHAGARAYVLIICQGEVLVIKNWFGLQRWHLPGGGLRRREDAQTAASREVGEEIGLLLDHVTLKPLTSGQWASNSHAYFYQIFFVSLDSKPPLRLKRPEVLEASWVKPSDLNVTNAPSEILSAIRKAIT